MHSHAKAVVASAVIVAACLLLGLGGRCAAQAAALVPGQVIVPPELSDAAGFVNMLQRVGVVVQEVRSDSSLTKLFVDAVQATFILTNLGAVEVAIFKGEMDAESITVTYGKNSDSRMMHGYDFSRPKGNKVGWTTNSTPLYFTLHKRWFIQTLSAQLDVLIKQALGQANSLNR